MGEKVIRWRWVYKRLYKVNRDMRKNEKHLLKWGVHGSRWRNKKQRNMRYFGNLIVVSNPVIYNILHKIVKWFSYGCRYVCQTILKPHLPLCEGFTLCSKTIL